MTRILTIGFTQKSAQQFFGLLTTANVKNVFDVRLNNTSQLSGYAKKDDLSFFLSEFMGIGYQELKDLAPSKAILSAYQKKELSWSQYEDLYREEIARRSVERTINESLLDNGCLLCSEHKPHHCHRRVAVDYLNSCWGSNLEIKHLY
ncbi:MAG: DUF488 domain-containing protein [Rhodocyclaceae bacterium]|nr:DUF488 domain-containing protein [Rhodocyclaceae bacterium]